MSKTRRSNYNSSIDEEAKKLEEDLKNEIKKLYLGYVNSEKRNAEYEEAFKVMKKEYSNLYEKYQQEKDKNKKQQQQQQQQLQQQQQQQKQETQPTKRHYNYSDNESENIQYIVKKKKKPKVIYVENEDSDSEELEDIDNRKNKTEIKNKKEDLIPTQKTKKNKKGISKVIKF